VSLGLEKVAYIELSVTYFADTASGGIWRVLSAVVYSSRKSSGFYYTYFAHRTTTEFAIMIIKYKEELTNNTQIYCF
jgi:hypothetical protein